MYAGGADTIRPVKLVTMPILIKLMSPQTVSAFGWFIYAMLLHPEVQRKAQEQIDAVVGNGRLPDFSDRPSLPYVDAVLNECLRWRPVLNLGTYILSMNGSVKLILGISRYPSSSKQG